MVVQFILPAVAGTLVGSKATGASKDKEMKEKLELTKRLANLTPEQAEAVDAIAEQSVEEMKTRVELGIGPFRPLPEKASERAKEARERRIAKLEEKKVGTKYSPRVKPVHVTDQERAEINAAPDRQEAIRDLVSKKAEEMKRLIKEHPEHFNVVVVEK